VRELISLDTILCPEVPEQLVAEDWEHNVHADYQVRQFHSLPYLTRRVTGIPDVHLLALLPNPEAGEVAALRLPGFDWAGFEVLDVRGDVSALTNCGGFPEIFAPTELNAVGLLDELARAEAIRRALPTACPGEPHTACDVWAVWRATRPTAGAGAAT
jgi:hypothetical protein